MKPVLCAKEWAYPVIFRRNGQRRHDYSRALKRRPEIFLSIPFTEECFNPHALCRHPFICRPRGNAQPNGAEAQELRLPWHARHVTGFHVPETLRKRRVWR